MAKLSPRYCGPFTILKRIGEVAYKLDLPSHSRVHPVFHVSRLHNRLGHDEPSVLPHEPERILDYHEQRTRHHVRRQALVKWKDRPEEGSTWENVTVLRKRFPTFVFEDENQSPRRGE